MPNKKINDKAWETLARNPLYRRGDIIPWPAIDSPSLILDLLDRKNYYQYYSLQLETGVYTRYTSWVVDERLQKDGLDKLA